MKVFSKQKMIDRLTQEGLSDRIDDSILEIMNMLDGKEVSKNDFKALVLDELEYFIEHEGRCYPINPNDCIEK